ncbi:MAG: hypothetical protein GY898_10795 [Proteobacteria bacterium]|nr:hypothetical protein [Pseudomonadota bacterium]
MPQAPDTFCPTLTVDTYPEASLFLVVYGLNSVLCSSERVDYRLTATAGGKPHGLTSQRNDFEVEVEGGGDDDDSAAGDDDDSAADAR